MVVICGTFIFSEVSSASVFDYLNGYNLGIDSISSSDNVHVTYERDYSGAPSKNCSVNADDQTKMTCNVYLQGGRGGGFLSEYLKGYGVFLQQPFKRQGLYYFGYDVGFGLRVLKGALSERDAEETAPLTSLSFQMYGVAAYPYIQFGITPAQTWPDFLISIGPVIQAFMGQVSVNERPETVAIVQGSKLANLLSLQGFLGLELVLWRFGEGAFSLFSNRYLVSSRVEKGAFYPKEIDGMSHFSATFQNSVYGMKLLLNWP